MITIKHLEINQISTWDRYAVKYNLKNKAIFSPICVWMIT